jgi:vacuolar-type H+-ATPase subunit H
VDGIVIAWESDVQESIRSAKEGTEEAWDDTKEESKKAWGSTEARFLSSYRQTRTWEMPQ